MSDSLAAQLANVKLRPSKDKTKDFSDPKLAGELILAYDQNRCSPLRHLSVSPSLLELRVIDWFRERTDTEAPIDTATIPFSLGEEESRRDKGVSCLGFISKDQIHAYQNTALESNMEEWQKFLVDGTELP